MIASITACSVTAGRGAGLHGHDRRQGERRQTADRRRPAAAREAEPKTPPRGPGPHEGLRTALVMPSPTRATEAARAFSAGNCYLSGNLIDRCI